MYRLLIYKGYRFPDVPFDSYSALSPQPVLKTADELESEDMKNYGVKLEELLRIGTPAALAQANDLMKIMSGYEKRVDYNKEFEDDLDRINQKVHILNDMLNHKDPQDRFTRDPTLIDLVSAIKSAQQKIQKMIAEDDNSDNVVNLLKINDFINSVLEKYNCFEKGDVSFKSLIDTQRTTQAVENSPTNNVGPINLIDFDDFSSSKEDQIRHVNANVDLLDLNNIDFKPVDKPLLDFNPSSSKIVNTVIPPENISKMDIFNTPVSSLLPNLMTPALVSPKNKDLLAEFEFHGVPEKSTNKEVILFDKNGLQIKLKLQFKDKNTIAATAVFMNITPVEFKDVNFQVSIPKSMEIKMETISGTTLVPFNQKQLYQSMLITNPTMDTLRFRYKIQYNINGAIVNESGEYSNS